jgi:hypothetical protein
LCCAGRGKEQLFDAINALAIFEWNKNDRAAGGAVYFQDYYPTNQTHVCAESLGDAEEGRGDMCGVRTACALVMNER